MNFSRRQATAPSPPSPAFTWMRTSSTNFTWPPYDERRGPVGSAALATSGAGRAAQAFGTDDRDHAAVAAGLARTSRCRRTVAKSVKSLPIPTFCAGVEERAALADQDVARRSRSRSRRSSRRGAARRSRGRCGWSPVPFCEPLLASFPSGGLAADRGDDDLGVRLPVAALLGPAFLLLAEVDHLGVCLPWATISPSTAAPATVGLPTLASPSPPTSSASKESFLPTSPSSSSTRSLSPLETRYCLPPVWITAYIEPLLLEKPSE